VVSSLEECVRLSPHVLERLGAHIAARPDDVEVGGAVWGRLGRSGGFDVCDVTIDSKGEQQRSAVIDLASVNRNQRWHHERNGLTLQGFWHSHVVPGEDELSPADVRALHTFAGYVEGDKSVGLLLNRTVDSDRWEIGAYLVEPKTAESAFVEPVPCRVADHDDLADPAVLQPRRVRSVPIEIRLLQRNGSAPVSFTDFVDLPDKPAEGALGTVTIAGQPLFTTALAELRDARALTLILSQNGVPMELRAEVDNKGELFDKALRSEFAKGKISVIAQMMQAERDAERRDRESGLDIKRAWQEA
jgi:hypothetical protein